MMKSRGITFKLIVLFSVSTAVILSLIVGFNYTFSRRMNEKSVEESARNLAMSSAYRIEAILVAAREAPEDLVSALESGTYDKDELLALQESITIDNDVVYGMAVAFEPYAFDKSVEYFSPYFYKSKGRIHYVDLAKDSYGYSSWDWYQIPREIGASYWTEPYFDEGGGNILMTTYSVPFYDDAGETKKFKGVVTADVSLEWLRDIISSIRILDTGYAYLISKNGAFVTHPKSDLIMNDTIFSVADGLGDKEMRRIANMMVQGKSGFAIVTSMITQKTCWMYYTPVPSTGWSLAVLFPQDELLAPVRKLRDFSIIAGLIGVALLILVITVISRSFTKPIRQMARSAEIIATGNLDAPLVEVKSNDEVGKLAEAFGYMTRSLKDYIKRLTETVAAKERIQSELSIARRIQMSILPKRFPKTADSSAVDLYAKISPAKEVGGDFYDFHYIDKDRLCFVVGDVSGKGVPASLFMAVTKTFLKATVSREDSPERVMSIVNKELSLQDDQSLFVTVFFGIINTRTGEVFYTNGGHNSPVIVKKNGAQVFVEPVGGMVIGLFSEAEFETGKFILHPEETLFLYTDGVTEAMNEARQQYSEERLEEILKKSADKNCRETIEAVSADIKKFAGNAAQSDDITMMVIKRRVL